MRFWKRGHQVLLSKFESVINLRATHKTFGATCCPPMSCRWLKLLKKHVENKASSCDVTDHGDRGPPPFTQRVQFSTKKRLALFFVRTNDCGARQTVQGIVATVAYIVVFRGSLHRPGVSYISGSFLGGAGFGWKTEIWHLSIFEFSTFRVRAKMNPNRTLNGCFRPSISTNMGKFQFVLTNIGSFLNARKSDNWQIFIFTRKTRLLGMTLGEKSREKEKRLQVLYR